MSAVGTMARRDWNVTAATAWSSWVHDCRTHDVDSKGKPSPQDGVYHGRWSCDLSDAVLENLGDDKKRQYVLAENLGDDKKRCR